MRKHTNMCMGVTGGRSALSGSLVTNGSKRPASLVLMHALLVACCALACVVCLSLTAYAEGTASAKGESATQEAPAETSAQRTVRVGYYENEVFQEGAHEGAVKTGYAYEYYRKLSEYTGWRYEYVYGSYRELYQKLLDGEVDLLAGLAYREDRAGLIGYPHDPMGREAYILVCHDREKKISADPATLTGKRIGVLESAVVDALEFYLEEHEVEAEVVTYPDYNALFTAFDNKKVDVLAAEGGGAYDRPGSDVLGSFGSSDYYLCVSKSAPGLLEELDTAQAQLAAEEPHYLSALQLKYYAGTLSSRVFSEAEQSWLATHDTLRVGYLNNYLPYSDTDDAGQATGMVSELVPQMLEALSIDSLKVSFHSYDSYDAMIDDMTAEVIDVAFPVGGGLYYSEENGIYQSTPISSTSTELVFSGDFSDATTAKFAVNENNRMQQYFVLTNFPEAKVVPMPSVNDCLDAVIDGTATCTTLNGLRAHDILRNRAYRDLSTMQLDKTDDRCFGVEIGDEGLLKLVNRGISVMSREDVQDMAVHYADELYSFSIWDAILDHLAVFSALVLGIAGLIIYLLVRDVLRTRAQVRDKESARLVLEAKNRELEASWQALEETDEIIAEAGFGIWHIIYEEGRPARLQGNPKMLELLGVAGCDLTEEEVYDAWYTRILSEDIPSVERSVNEMLAGRLSENTYRWNHPERGIIYVRCGGLANIREEHRQMLRGYHSDVTDIVREDQEHKEELAQALSAAEHANRAKTAFLNNMSHDIRTPMNAIVGFTSLAMTHADNPEQVRDYLDKISVSSQHLLSLINDVLDMSRIESGKLTIDEAEVHLPDLIHDLRTIIQANVAAKQLDLLIDTQDIVSEDIICDRLRLSQVLLNILTNAIKFTPNGGTIGFQVIEWPTPATGMTTFEFRIEDTGIGMSKEFQQTIFDAFSRERTSTVSGIQGTGLGMAITKNIVDMMGGTISVQSEEGAGSEFVVVLPCKVSGSPAETKPIEELMGLRALVVDDDVDSCLSVCSMLRKLGTRPDWTNYGKEAVIRAREARDQGEAFSVYIVDWMLSDLNGIEVVRRLRKRVGSDSRIIMLTAYDWTDIEDEAREAGVSTFCSKPLFMSELRSVLQTLFCEQEETEVEASAKTVDLAGKRVLLAEDIETNQLIATTILMELGMEVDVASDGVEAVDMVNSAPAGTYDAVLMDIQMPQMDGYEAARQIRALPDEAKRSIPIVAVTANAFEEDRQRALEAGMNGHLAKPYDIPEMVAMLEVILG